MLYIWACWLHVCLYTTFMPGGVMDICKPLHGYWESNLGRLEGQLCFHTEPFLWSYSILRTSHISTVSTSLLPFPSPLKSHTHPVSQIHTPLFNHYCYMLYILRASQGNWSRRGNWVLNPLKGAASCSKEFEGQRRKPTQVRGWAQTNQGEGKEVRRERTREPIKRATQSSWVASHL